MTTVKYNGVDVASGLGPTPLLGRQIDMVQFGNRWAQLETITLKGQLTGNCFSYADWVSAQTGLLNRFKSDYKDFQIYDGATLAFSRSSVRVSSVEFDQSDYAYFLPYTVSLQVYPSGFFSGVYGVLDPSDSFSYVGQDDYTVSLEHTVSAKGINTHPTVNNALANAKSWVSSKTGLAGLVLPAFISYAGQTPCLKTTKEVINRLTGAYEVTDSYSIDISQTGAGILRFIVEYSVEAESGVATVSVRGDIVGCKNGSIDVLRARYASFSAFNEALKVYQTNTGSTSLNPTPTQKGDKC